MDEAKRYSLGVLFVHGIGTQRARNTVVPWGDELVRVIREATANNAVVTVDRARPGSGTSAEPAEAEVTIVSKDSSERWLLTEAWWAESFPAPTYGELVSWSVRAVPWSLVVGIAHRYSRSVAVEVGPDGHPRQPSTKRKVWAWLVGAAQLGAALVFSPFLVLILAIMLVLGLLPIAQLRTFILSAQRVLTGAIGDSLAFVESPHRHALIRTRIIESLERLQAKCDRTVVVAHSQGAAVSLDALDLISEANDSTGTSKLPEGLVTFGSGVHQLASLRALSMGQTDTSPLVSGVVVAFLAVFSGVRFVSSVRAGELQLLDLLRAGAALAIGIGVLTAATLAFQRLEPRFPKAARGLLAVILTAILIALIVYTTNSSLPPALYLVFSVLMLLATAYSILSERFLDAATAQLREPPGLSIWKDLYASADLVPNGPTRLGRAEAAKGGTVPQRVLDATKIWNRGSAWSDHTTYWENRDSFVLRVAQVCAEVARSRWRDALKRNVDHIDSRSEWRVGLLRIPRWFVVLTWVAVFAILLIRGVSNVWLPYSFPKWTPSFALAPLRATELFLLVFVAMWANSWLVEWPWKAWSRKEQSLFISGKAPGDTPFLPLLGMGLAMGLSFLAFYCVVTFASLAELRARFTTFDDLFGLLALPILIGGPFAAATWFRRHRPAPAPPPAVTVSGTS